MNDEKRVKLSTLIYAILIIIVIFIGVISILAYGTQTEIGKRISVTVSSIIPFPAAIINYTHLVYIKDVEKDLASIERFYKSYNFSDEGLRIDFTTSDGKKRLQIKKREILDKLIEDKIIEVLANKKGIRLSQADVDNVINQTLNEYGTANDIKSDLLNSYGWSMEDFKKFVVMPNAYKAALSSYVSNNELDVSIAKTKIEEAQKQLIKGTDFAQVVKEYSVGASKENGGELGWVKKSQLLPELQDILFGSKNIEKNSILETSIGFHIIEIKDKKKDNGEDMIEIRQIFVAKDTFADWLENQKKNLHIFIPLSGFAWDSSAGSVDFKSEEMRNFEKNERSKTAGDLSIMF
ncbi:MAG TPA: peptidylprolyl isomerase [Candidatus Moranbacteria bacterium]|nr:peptidylprolyl isomerase [Candidatus Moranbacteria bacterium]HRZ33806.1 peptidylprolyl isomerase [Candidatus Moranbacteria bacterium]